MISGVVGGERGHRKHAVAGDTVNTAARFESVASVGGIVIGEEALRGLPQGTQADALEPLQLKGKSRPLPAYLLTSLPS